MSITPIQKALVEAGFIPAPVRKLLTREQVKAKFIAEGKTITSWAQEHGYTTQEVYRVLGVFTKAKHGKGHEIAIALGIKADPETLKEIE